MIRIVFQNKNFVVCDKPAEVLSVPAREKSDPRPCLGLGLQKELGRAVFPVHRLDYEVSGLILFALDSRSHRISQEWFQKKHIRKQYRALTPRQDFTHWPESVPTDRTVLHLEAGLEWTWKTRILRGKRRSFESPHGEWAETRARVHSLEEDRVHWELNPITGKPHQLRLELSRHGFPIVGDTLYGSKIPYTEAGIALRAVEVDLSGVADRLGLPQKISIN